MQYKGVPITLTQSKHTYIHNTHIQNTHTRTHVHPLENNLGIPGSLILHQQFYKEKTCLSLEQPTSLFTDRDWVGQLFLKTSIAIWQETLSWEFSFTERKVRERNWKKKVALTPLIFLNAFYQLELSLGISEYLLVSFSIPLFCFVFRNSLLTIH